MPFSTFLYDASRDGYDSDTWSTSYGAPTVLAGSLALQEAGTVHRGDIMRGDLTMSITIPNSPTGGESRRFGFYSPNSGAYLWFQMEAEVFSAAASDGGSNSSSTAIAWSDGVVESWEGNSIEFRIIWEAGMGHFYVNGARRATLAGAAIPRDPMALYFSNANTDLMTVQYVNAEALQTFLMHVGEAGSGGTGSGVGPAFKSDVITIAEVVTLVYNFGILPSMSDSVTLTESQTVYSYIKPPAQADAITITESVTPVKV